MAQEKCRKHAIIFRGRTKKMRCISKAFIGDEITRKISEKFYAEKKTAMHSKGEIASKNHQSFIFYRDWRKITSDLHGPSQSVLFTVITSPELCNVLL